MTFVAGQGNDKDTFERQIVYIMDSSSYPLHPAELCLQLHNNQTGNYSAAYHALKHEMIAAGTLGKTSCPHNYVC